MGHQMLHRTRGSPRPFVFRPGPPVEIQALQESKSADLIRIKACFAANDLLATNRPGAGTMEHRQIPGTPIFDGEAAQRGYALNKMCFSFNSAGNRAEFLRDEDAYCTKFGLTPQQRLAVKNRDVLEMIAAGGNVYYLAKLAGIFGLNVQDIGAQQTGMTVENFKAKLAAAGK
jgi:protocatechuate 4,5-dioxygenase alpha chain